MKMIWIATTPLHIEKNFEPPGRVGEKHPLEIHIYTQQISLEFWINEI